jgi:hypothetical protein
MVIDINYTSYRLLGANRKSGFPIGLRTSGILKAQDSQTQGGSLAQSLSFRAIRVPPYQSPAKNYLRGAMLSISGTP